MKIVGFNGSPRTGGNTAWAINRILGAAQTKNAQTRLFHAGTLNIHPCIGCLRCVKGDGCVVKDDMQPVYEALLEADALVLGMPIYMGQMSAQAKIFTDRLFAQITPRFSPRFKEANAGKQLALVFTQGNPNPGKFKTYIDYTRDMFGILEFEVLEVVVVAGTRSAEAAEQQAVGQRLQAVGEVLGGGSYDHF